MSNSSEEHERSSSSDEGPRTGIGDEDLPEDLVPGEGNPLAEPLEDDVSREELGMGTPGTSPDDEGDDEDHED